ncbi:MAG: biopolymer transporter ExbD [Alphaproteobacteria bacterium]|nr:MAG: biopolymer transporter ExbD [Alphaproteobacteria bacterium]
MSPPVSAPPQPRLADSWRRARAKRRPSISLTPLIDVVFILLVFFMLVSTFLDWRSIELNVPTRTAAGASMKGALLVEVRPDGVRLSGETVSLDTLASRVGERVAARPDQRVLIKPAAGVALQETVRVLDRLAAVGAADMMLIRNPGR